MRAQVERERHCRMAKHLGHDLRVDGSSSFRMQARSRSGMAELHEATAQVRFSARFSPSPGARGPGGAWSIVDTGPPPDRGVRPGGLAVHLGHGVPAQRFGRPVLAPACADPGVHLHGLYTRDGVRARRRRGRPGAVAGPSWPSHRPWSASSRAPSVASAALDWAHHVRARLGCLVEGTVAKHDVIARRGRFVSD